MVAQVFIADRSPFSAVFYAAKGMAAQLNAPHIPSGNLSLTLLRSLVLPPGTGKLLEPVIREHIREMREAAGIEVYTVYLQVNQHLPVHPLPHQYTNNQ